MSLGSLSKAYAESFLRDERDGDGLARGCACLLAERLYDFRDSADPLDRVAWVSGTLGRDEDAL